MIKQSDIGDYSSNDYLENNPDFSKQLVAILNRVDGLSTKYLRFGSNVRSDGDCGFNKISYDNDKSNGFSFGNDEIEIISSNRDDLLQVEIYQTLTEIAKKYRLNVSIKGRSMVMLLSKRFSNSNIL